MSKSWSVRAAGALVVLCCALQGFAALDYNQRQDLKEAGSQLNKVESLATDAENAARSGDAMSARAIESLKGTLADARKKLGEAEALLAALPADDRDVQGASRRAARAKAKLDAIEQIVPAAAAPAPAPAGNPPAAGDGGASKEQYQQDLDKLIAWADSYGDSRLLEGDPQTLAALVTEAPAVEEEVKQITARWGAIIEDRRDRDGQDMERKLRYFAEKYDGFTGRVERFKQEGPAQITSNLDEAEKMTDLAVAEKKPLFFTGGIPQRVKWAEDKLLVLAAIHPAAAKPLQERLAQVKASLPQKQAALKDDIIAANQLPPDNYNGPDKQEVVKRVTDAWKKEHPDHKILAVRIPSQQWKRDTRWTLNTGAKAFEKTDRSKLQGQVIVQDPADPKLAVVQVVELYKDHLSNDAVKAVCWPADDVPVENVLLASKVK